MRPAPLPADRGRGAGGFTLLELLIVVALLALAVAVAVPSFQDVSGARLRSATRILAGTVRFVHAEAATTGAMFRIEFDLDENSFWVSRCTPSLAGTCEWEKDEASLSATRRMPDGVVIASVRSVRDDLAHTTGLAHIHFLPKGYVEQAVIHLKRDGHDSDDDAFTLLVLPVGGRVKILPGVHGPNEGMPT